MGNVPQDVMFKGGHCLFLSVFVFIPEQTKLENV